MRAWVLVADGILGGILLSLLVFLFYVFFGRKLNSPRPKILDPILALYFSLLITMADELIFLAEKKPSVLTVKFQSALMFTALIKGAVISGVYPLLVERFHARNGKAPQ